MTLSADSILKPMIVAAKVAIADSWEEVESYTVPELEKIATTIVDIEANVAEHNYTQEVADLMLRMQMWATQAVIVSTTGLILLQVEKALNEALAAVAVVVNKAVGFPLVATA